MDLYIHLLYISVTLGFFLIFFYMFSKTNNNDVVHVFYIIIKINGWLQRKLESFERYGALDMSKIKSKVLNLISAVLYH